MIPALLITFREVIEASLIIATILGILVKLKQGKSIKTVWIATCAACLVSLFLLGLGSIAGYAVQTLYSGKTGGIFEGTLMIISAFFITWAVFFLHTYFGRKKIKLLQQVKVTLEREEQKGIFLLCFTAVLREGIEIAFFLSTIYFSSNPVDILSGFTIGTVLALLVGFGLFSTTLKLPVFYAFRITSILLILFAGGLLARGIHEFSLVGIIPQMASITLHFLPAQTNFLSELMQSIFGITRKMDFLQLGFYTFYVGFMSWWVFVRKSAKTSPLIKN